MKIDGLKTYAALALAALANLYVEFDFDSIDLATARDTALLAAAAAARHAIQKVEDALRDPAI